MTRKKLRRTMVRLMLVFLAILVIALICKLYDKPILKVFYQYINDMSVIFISLGGAYLAHIFQKRSHFLKSLREEWRVIVDTKSTLVAYCERPETTIDDFVEVRRSISQAIDYMRIVYMNVGESKAFVGFYSYEPLHDMRRAINTIDPRKRDYITYEEKRGVKKQIVLSFLALREEFLDEFDIAEPSHPVLVPGSRRHKQDGSTRKGKRMMSRQQKAALNK